MPNRPKRLLLGGERHAKERRRQYDQERDSRGRRTIYNSKWWKETVRPTIASRDNWMCKACGCDVGRADRDYQIDHVKPRPMGASINTDKWDHEDNLQLLCSRCGAAKSAKERG